MSPHAPFRIRLSLLLLATGGLARILEGPSAFALSVATALLLLILLLIAYSRGLIGGGDVKIMTALAVGLSPLDCYRFVVATAIAGGILGIAYLLLSREAAVSRARSDEHRYLAVSLRSKPGASAGAGRFPTGSPSPPAAPSCCFTPGASEPCRSVSSSSGLLLLTALGLGLVGYQVDEAAQDVDGHRVPRPRPRRSQSTCSSPRTACRPAP